MTMTNTLTDVNELVTQELKMANEEYPAFGSTHEGYGVMLEECDELQDQLKLVKKGMKEMWERIKADEVADAVSFTYGIEQESVKAAAEAIQIAAMAQKFRQSFERKGEDGWHF